MKRYPKEADGCRADIYSLAKTLWMVIADDKLGFDGQYNFFSENHKLRKYPLVKNHHIALVEELIYKATDENPLNRPTASEFKDELIRWRSEEDNHFLAEETEWSFLENRIFPNGIIPESTKWTDIEDIIKIFNLFTLVDSTNHMFFPDCGGLNLQKVIKSPEKDCIYLITEGNYYNVLSPKCLYYEKFSDRKWNYFLLELNELSQVIPEKNQAGQFCEELCEDHPGHYVCASDFDYGVYSYDSGIPLPLGARKIQRYFKGRFLVVFGNGYYNAISGTYDARHSDAPTAEDFHKYINKLSLQTSNLNNILYNSSEKEQFIETYLNKKESENPFKENKNDSQNKKSRKNKKNIRIRRKLLIFVLFHHKYFLFRKKNCPGDVNFYITLEKSMINFSFSEGVDKKELLYLDNNGYFTRNPAEKLLFSSRDSVQLMYNDLKKKKECICRFFGKELVFYDFVMNIEKPLKLKKLFTLDDIKQAMKAGDDRKTQWLVVDENGKPLLVDNTQIRNTYPVHCSNSFVARNNYLGKYSTLSAADLCYKELLENYLSLLNNEENYHKYDGFTEDDILKMIKETNQNVEL